MPASVKGGIELRKALKQFSPDLAKETQKELAAILKPITATARGYIPSNTPLSGWANANQQGAWSKRLWSSSQAKRGIGYKTTPSKPNRSGWRSLARIVNASPAGSIYETAGRLNPYGRPQAPRVKVVAPSHENYGKYVRSGNKGQSMSNNPNAGKQFIESLDRTGKIVDAYQRGAGEAGRSSRKMKGRAIFRAWKEDQGKATAAVIKAIEKSRDKLEARVK